MSNITVSTEVLDEYSVQITVTNNFTLNTAAGRITWLQDEYFRFNLESGTKWTGFLEGGFPLLKALCEEVVEEPAPMSQKIEAAVVHTIKNSQDVNLRGATLK